MLPPPLTPVKFNYKVDKQEKAEDESCEVQAAKTTKKKSTRKAVKRKAPEADK